MASVLRSGKVNYWTGEEGRRFEQEFAALVGTRYAVALANGTVALELALHALGIGPGDEVIVPSRTFIASASCVVARGARPVIADVDPVSQNLTAETIRAVLTAKTKALIAVHLAGWPCDMESILRLAKENRLRVVEDCAQAHGATYKGRLVGGFGDVAA
ncbi:MAG: DegT/DnrJ/EryC1/StrS family aminotransferase, partial [Burkholderiales bacterium]